MASANDLAKMVPGFDFLQGLMKTGGGLPSMGQWIAPTLDPDELGKRIDELRTVQFWLEQNAKLLATTIQALEVQRMTLSTLKTMNLPLADLRESLKVAMPTGPVAAARAPVAAPTKVSTSASAATPAAPTKRRAAPAAKAAAPAPAASAVDPMQWWGALTQQFTELAGKALRDSSAEAARQFAGAMVKQGVDAASTTLKQAAAAPAKVAGLAAKAAAGASQAGARRKPGSRG